LAVTEWGVILKINKDFKSSLFCGGI